MIPRHGHGQVPVESVSSVQLWISSSSSALIPTQCLVLEGMRQLNARFVFQVLIFSQMVMMLDLLADFCDLRGYKFGRLDGTMKLETRANQVSVHSVSF